MRNIAANNIVFFIFNTFRRKVLRSHPGTELRASVGFLRQLLHPNAAGFALNFNLHHNDANVNSLQLLTINYQSNDP